MKILFVHNRYGITSGEEVMIDRIIKLLRSEGHEVRTFFRGGTPITDYFSKGRAFFSGIYSFSTKHELKKVIREFQPDLVQVQNLYPNISASILPMLREAGIPVVMRLSNYRLVCPSGTFLSHGELCSRCSGGREYWCVLRNCENSFFKSLGYALRNWVARLFRLYSDNVTRYYAQTTFQKEVLVSEGFEADSIDVIPNMVETIAPTSQFEIGSYVGFVGRMSPEKGIDLFIDTARKCPGISFKVAGDVGRFHSINTVPKNVELVGHLERTALNNFYAQCQFIVVPSLWYEGFPGVIIEAMRHAKPVIASRIGGLPEIVENNKTGLLFGTGDGESLTNAVTQLWCNVDAIRTLGQAGQKKVFKEYVPELYYERLMAVYNEATATVAK